MSNDFQKWLAFGTGVGIEIGDADLRVVAVKVRPTGVELIGDMIVERFAERPAAEWGVQCSRFLKSVGAGHLAACALLPRDEVIVRQVALPGVADEDLASAIAFQIDSLHPYAEDEATYAWTRTGDAGHILVGITRRAVIQRYAALFSEAGLKIAAVTFSAAAIYGALRVLGAPAAAGFLALHARGDEIEAYGESPSRPVFSASFDVPGPAFADKARSLALAELRLPPDTEPVQLSHALPGPKRLPEGYQLETVALPYAAAIAAACPRLAVGVNLLPEELRNTSSRMMFIPTIALGVLVLASAGALWGYSVYEDDNYRKALQGEITRLEPHARQAVTMDKAIDTARRRSLMLDNFRKRTKSDLDALAELTKLLTPPTYVHAMELTRDGVRLSGETDHAEPLLKTIDKSPLFEGSEFTMPMARTGSGETFAIQSRREGALP